MTSTQFPHSQPLLEIIRDRTPLTFAEFMAIVLYHPQYGYYSSGTVGIGKEGDYFTSSSLGADFGELLAKQWVQLWEILGKPDPFHLVEMGAGKGLLAADSLQFLERYYPDCLKSLEYIIIEQSPGLIEQQQQVLRNTLDKGTKISWRRWDDLPDHLLVGCCFSNELVDAFPVHKVTIKEGELKEIYVTWQEEQLVETVGELSTPKIKEYFAKMGLELAPPNYPEDYVTEVNLAALDWLKRVSQKLKQGYLLTIDYGYPAHRYYNPQRYQGTLKCYYQHRHHDNPYVNLGYQDITAHVNFTALEKYGEDYQLEQQGFTQQAIFLMALGLGDRLADLSSGKYDIQQVLQRRDALHQLLDPNGLGGFGVLVQSKGLTPEQKAETLLGFQIPDLV
ncbi:class I SAM-dependent methyltransferase [Spirulina sp. CS-785/01]|uniref:class I SAM-dependent methyltransferase n=1 Tax=Spirulina sp. CS-785/01 TaxID=3021716 RepID=UPI0023301C93|nr:class I SAM-dependent methyltransferase [Spirulina sp. CS-785/01]MDB9314175.1 class I SAM-dependent methyltransferase [Spirulina sp. CS-785/01]